ncbi:hypothetical protein RSOLAG22IIIB_03756 [Rhizoctonia solani]|uniref:Uncharacterized protein n=1 Tax=Rhizoctonia solani TaxID=456999 RepID=A0A0K6FS92_9AGAM|nr:hypothetical protein RSOLAG22IIIB_03756 [Rhizoctonia solani]
MCQLFFDTHRNFVEPVWTEEPSPMVGADGGATVRGQQATVEALTPVSLVHNQAQAFALGQPVPALITTKTPEPESVIQPDVQHEIEVEEDSVRHRTSYNEASTTIPEFKDEPHTYQAQGYSETPSIPTRHKLPPYRSPLRVGTCPAPLFPGHPIRNRITRPHPLRMSSTHGRNDAVRRGASGSSLLASLFAGSYEHSTLFILAVAVAYDDLEDPQHDFELMQAWLKDHKSGDVRFRGLSGEEATREKIENAICELYREALQVPGSNLLILLTGEGHYTNKMHLLKGRFITDSDLRIWLWKLRNESKPTEVPTTIILDYCRPNKHIPLGNAQEGVKFIWSCSLGQTAAALRLPSTQDIPRSCFLLALMMFSYNCRIYREGFKSEHRH